jgi:hypothetical protein
MSFEKIIKLSEELPGTFNVFHIDGMLIGRIYQEVDGFYVFVPISNGGFWPQYVLEAIHIQLHRLNYEWENTIAKDPQVSTRAGYYRPSEHSTIGSQNSDIYLLSRLRSHMKNTGEITEEINYIDLIAENRGWHPPNVGESISVGMDGKRYRITREE